MPQNPNKTFHLDERDLAVVNPYCLICHQANRQAVGLLQIEPTVELLRCEACGIVSASRMPRETTLARFYEQYYQSDFYQKRREHVAVLAPRKLARHIFRGIRHAPSTGKMEILDFGGGDGSVALWLARALLVRGAAGNIHVTVIDFGSDSVIASDSPNIIIAKQSTQTSIPRDRFDIVLASAILEHVPEPKEVLESLLESLRLGGIFYARTPYIVPLRRLLQLFGVTYDFTYPAHLHDMGSRFWKTMLTTLGRTEHFKLLTSRPSFAETPFAASFLRALASRSLKAPWYLLGDIWPLVGGWEVFIERKNGVGFRRRPQRARPKMRDRCRGPGFAWAGY